MKNHDIMTKIRYFHFNSYIFFYNWSFNHINLNSNFFSRLIGDSAIRPCYKVAKSLDGVLIF